MMADTDNITSKANAAAGCDPAQGAALAEAFAAALRERLSMLESVAIPGFGSLTPVKHEERVETDAESGRRTLLPPHIAVNFIPGSKLRKLLPSNE